MRVLLMGENASMRISGEASFPYLYFKLLRGRGIDVRMVTHARVRDELRELLGEDFGRISFIEDDPLDLALFRLEQRLPPKLREQSLAIVRHVRARRRMRPVVRELVRRHAIDLIHEVTPISPKMPSCAHGLGAPVVIGPLCGGMSYPPGFRFMESLSERVFEWWGRRVAHLVNGLIPGKLRAEALIVANGQTRQALPRGCRGAVFEGVPDIGVNLGVWNRGEAPPRAASDGPVRFVFLGRLVAWKGVEFLLEAFARVAASCPGVELEILGDGPLRGSYEAKAQGLGIRDRVEFGGWVEVDRAAARMRQADIFVLPSLRECGGSVAFEAMALGLPVVVVRWGGPGLYVTDQAGIRVEPSSREGFVGGLAEAMLRVARDPQLRQRMGEAATRLAVEGIFNWDRKIDRTLEIYEETIGRATAARPVPTEGGHLKGSPQVYS